jgi:hypothetical protein
MPDPAKLANPFLRDYQYNLYFGQAGSGYVPQEGRPFRQDEINALPRYTQQLLGGPLLKQVRLRPIENTPYDDGWTDGGVHPLSPLALYVSNYLYHKPDDVATHELTHSWQFTRSKNFKTKPAKTNPHDPYDYGGIEGLEDLRKKGLTVRNLSVEQFARVLEDFHKKHREVFGPGDNGLQVDAEGLAEWERVKSAYEPFIKQALNVPQRDFEDWWSGDDADPNPDSIPVFKGEAPGLPYEALLNTGFALVEPSKLHGGEPIMKKLIAPSFKKKR